MAAVTDLAPITDVKWIGWLAKEGAQRPVALASLLGEGGPMQLTHSVPIW